MYTYVRRALKILAQLFLVRLANMFTNPLVLAL